MQKKVNIELNVPIESLKVLQGVIGIRADMTSRPWDNVGTEPNVLPSRGDPTKALCCSLQSLPPTSRIAQTSELAKVIPICLCSSPPSSEPSLPVKPFGCPSSRSSRLRVERRLIRVFPQLQWQLTLLEEYKGSKTPPLPSPTLPPHPPHLSDFEHPSGELRQTRISPTSTMGSDSKA